MISRTIFILVGLFYCQSLLADCFRDGQNATQKGDFDEAIVHFTECIDTRFLPEGKKVSSYIYRGISYQQKGQGNLAIADYTSAIKLNPDYALSYNNRGITYNATGRYDLAIKDYSRAIRLDPSYSKAYNNRGNTYHERGQEDLAIADYSRAIELDRSYVDAYMNRGESYSSGGQNNLAIRDYTRVIELDPQHAPAYLQRSLSYKNTKQNDRARVDYERAVALSPAAADQPEELASLPKTAEPLPATAERLPAAQESLPTTSTTTIQAPIATIQRRERSVRADTSAPQIFARRGANVVSSSRYTVIGQATDPSGVGIVEVNGREAQLDAEGNFSASIILKPGTNEIEIVAYDIHENRSTEVFSIRREAGTVATAAPVAAPAPSNDLFDKIVSRSRDAPAARSDIRATAPARADSQAAGKSDLYDQLIQLDDLRARGILTEQEFIAAKALILEKR